MASCSPAAVLRKFAVRVAFPARAAGPGGAGGVTKMTRIRGGANAMAKRAFGWQPVCPSWWRGFAEGLG
jgi:hypothetical protein